MTTEQEFFKAFGIEPNVRNFEQYNYGQVERGLEIYKEAEKLERQGIIKITHRMLNARPENDCVYWEEMHYPPITPEIVLKLQSIIQKYDVFLKIPRGMSISNWTLKRCMELEQSAKIGDEVRGLFNE